MPELPEVETVRRGLEPVMTGVKLLYVEQRRANLRFAFPPDFVARLNRERGRWGPIVKKIGFTAES